jgi:hypothetical protein
MRQFLDAHPRQDGIRFDIPSHPVAYQEDVQGLLPEELWEQGMGQVVHQEHPTQRSEREQERGSAGPEHGE